MQRIIPCISMDEPGWTSDPVQLARRYAEQGAVELALETRGGTAAVRRAVERLAASGLSLIVEAPNETVAGAAALVEAGASVVVVQRAVLRDPDLIAALSRSVGRERVAVRILSQGEENGWRVLEESGGAVTEWDALTWSAVVEAQGGGAIVLESAERGPFGEPYDLTLCERVATSLHTPVIAAGAAETVEDVFDAFMIGGVAGVLVGDLLHSGRATIREIEAYLRDRGVEH